MRDNSIVLGESPVFSRMRPRLDVVIDNEPSGDMYVSCQRSILSFRFITLLIQVLLLAAVNLMSFLKILCDTRRLFKKKLDVSCGVIDVRPFFGHPDCAKIFLEEIFQHICYDQQLSR